MMNLKFLFQIIKDHQLYVSFSKCVFFLKSVAFLGHIVSGKGIEVYTRKTKMFKDLNRPITHRY